MNLKTKLTLLGMVCLAIVVAFVLWWHWRSIPRIAAPPRSAAPAITAASPGSSASPGTAIANNTPPANAQEAEEKRGRELQRTFQALNDNPIEFYGRAIDQFGAPVAEANVTGIVLVNTGVSSGERRSKTVTDAEGYFQFSGLRGQDIGIDIVKDGYEYRQRNSSFSYSYFEADHKRHIPDPKNPVIFTLWKKQGAETLVHYGLDRDIPADGKAIGVNLVTGKVGNDGADLTVTLSRQPLQMRYGEQGFAWKALVEVVGGGLIRVGRQDYYNLAPESGYEPRFEFAQDAQSIRDAQAGKIKWTWREKITDDFFIKSDGGKHYAHVRIGIFSFGRNDNDTIGGLTLEVWLNPSGSRNLEFDPKKAILPAP